MTRAQSKPATSSRGAHGRGSSTSPAACASKPHSSAAVWRARSSRYGIEPWSFASFRRWSFEQQEVMPVARHRHVEQPLQHHLRRGARCEIAAAHHIRDAGLSHHRPRRRGDTRPRHRAAVRSDRRAPAPGSARAPRRARRSARCDHRGVGRGSRRRWPANLPRAARARGTYCRRPSRRPARGGHRCDRRDCTCTDTAGPPRRADRGRRRATDRAHVARSSRPSRARTTSARRSSVRSTPASRARIEILEPQDRSCRRPPAHRATPAAPTATCPDEPRPSSTGANREIARTGYVRIRHRGHRRHLAEDAAQRGARHDPIAPERDGRSPRCSRPELARTRCSRSSRRSAPHASLELRIGAVLGEGGMGLRPRRRTGRTRPRRGGGRRSGRSAASRPPRSRCSAKPG